MKQTTDDRVDFLKMVEAGSKSLQDSDFAALGYEVSRGSYVDACDDSADGWYLSRLDSATLDRRGSGYPSRLDAYAAAYARTKLSTIID